MNTTAKRMLTLMLALVMLLSFAACGKAPAPETIPATQATENVPAPETSPAVEEITAVGDVSIPTQEEALDLLGLKEVPKSALCATYNTTIMAYNLGLDITGTVTTTRPIPDALKETPTIGVVTGRADFDFEKIIALAGDVVIADAQYEPKLRPTLEQQGIASCYVDTGDFQKLQQALAVLGSAFGKRQEVIDILTSWQNEVEAMQEEIKGKDSPVVLVIRKATNMATSASYVGSLFKTLNITCATDKMDLEDTSAIYVPMDAEKILAVDPDYILVPGGAELEADIAMLNELKTGEAWSTLSAVANDRVIAVTDSYYQPIADMDCIKALREILDAVYAD